MIRNGYNQVPHLIQDTTWESDKNTIKIQASYNPSTICDKSFEEFQYGHHDDYFANKNMSVSANVSFVGLMPRMNLSQFNCRCRIYQVNDRDRPIADQ